MRRLFGGLLVLAACALAQAAPLRVVLEADVARPAGATLRLEEVATLEGEDAARAGALALGKVPGPGQQRALSRQSILRALESAGFTRQEVTLDGARQPRVRGVGQSIDEKAVRVAVQKALAEALPGGEVKIVDLQVPANRALPPGDYRYEVELPENLRSGVNRLHALAAKDAGTERFGIYARLEVEGPMLVLARDVPRGARLAPEDLREEVRAYPRSGMFLYEREQVLGKVARTRLRLGQPLRANSIEPDWAVRAGQLVEAHFESGPVRLVFETKAREKGAVGSIVKISGQDGRSLVEARVVAPGKVVVLGSDEVEGT